MPVSASQAASPTVTIAARVCDSYTDISANRARNNLQESLRDLGPDSPYVGGSPVLPAQEQAVQPKCRPLPGWRFTMGTGIRAGASTGRWGSLSGVTGAYPRSIVTRPSVPLLDRSGTPTGQRIEGATTVELGPEEVARSSRSSSLWIQGGTPTDPVLDQQYPGEYGFGALRCTVDNLNGDNVEFIAFPQGSTHVFCFAYYVQPPPDAGTIVIRKLADGPVGLAKHPFRFAGDLSYTDDHDFTLNASPTEPDEQRFIRAANQPWVVVEDDVPGWERTAIDCRGTSPSSTAETEVARGRAQIVVAPGDTIVCVYQNRWSPPPAGLTLAKRSLDGTGGFRFDLTGPEGRSVTVTTTKKRQVFSSGPLALAAGTYVLRENLPEPTQAGRWQTESMLCNGRPVDPSGPVRLKLGPADAAFCLATNRFVPSGSIVVRKQTIGAAGAASFVIRPAGESSATFEQRARTSGPGVVTRATGDDTSDLPLGTYEIVETQPAAERGGHWTLDSVTCNGRPVGAGEGRAEVTLTRDEPQADCTYVNHFVRGEPSAIPAPGSTTSPPRESVSDGLRAASGPNADLVVTKRATPRVARPGQRLRYRIVVSNRGPAAARHVVLAEKVPEDQRRVRVRTNRGRCTSSRPFRCHIGTLRPGQRVVIVVDAIARRSGRTVNRVAVVSSTHDTKLSNNRASASVRVRRATVPRFAG